MLNAYWNGGEEAVKQMGWGGGPPLKKLSLTDAQISEIVARETLTAQAHLSL